MKLRRACSIAAVVIVPALAWAQERPNTQFEIPQVRVGLFSLNAEGRISGSAMNTADRVGGDLAGTVYISPCSGVGGASPDRAISAFATDVWRVTGTVLDLTPDQASVQIGWQRLRRDGQDEQSSPQQATLTLKRGERTTLETLSIPARGTCGARNISFDATFVSMREMFPGVVMGGGRGSSARTRSSSSQGTGGGAIVGPIKKEGEARWSPGTVNADLWLVRTSPGRPDETLHVRSQVIPAPLPFEFAPLTIQTASGVFTVKVQGTIESGSTSTGEAQLYFSANRATSFAPSNRAARDMAPTVEGSTKTAVPMPSPDDVLSFELPPLRAPGGATVPDTLSVRVKLTRQEQ
jgi:hypothetical protein